MFDGPQVPPPRITCRLFLSRRGLESQHSAVFFLEYRDQDKLQHLLEHEGQIGLKGRDLDVGVAD